MSDARAFAVIATISVVTILPRTVPFLALDRLSSNGYLRYLGTKMPTGVMVLLVAYTLKILISPNTLMVYPASWRWCCQLVFTGGPATRCRRSGWVSRSTWWPSTP